MNKTESLGWRRDLDATTVSKAAALGSEADEHVPGLTVLAHPDARRVGEQAPLTALVAGRAAAVSRLEPAFSQPAGGPLRPLADPHLSRRAFHIEPAAGGGAVIRCADARTRLAVDGVAVDGARKVATDALDHGVVMVVAERVALLFHRFDPVAAGGRRCGMVGDSDAAQRLRAAILQVADLSIPVLIAGETGSGKELVARAIHRASPRAGAPFVALNMGAMPPSLAPAEILGAAKGAFTGADRRRRGVFEQANGGSLFLDEIGDSPREVQIALLRVLEEGAVQPLATDRSVRVDVRVLAATDARLEPAVDRGDFSAPLLHRLSGFVIRVPPLRARRDDIGRLLMHFLRQELEACGMDERLEFVGSDRSWLPAPLVARLVTFDWPGNVRQLRNLARRLVAAHRHQPEIGHDAELERMLAASGAGQRSADHTPGPASGIARARRPAEIGEEDVVKTLRRHRWRVKPAARDLGISRTSLYALIARFPGVRLASDLSARELSAALDRHGGNVAAAADALRVSESGLQRRLHQLERGEWTG